MKKVFFMLLLIFLLTACTSSKNVNITYEPNGGSLSKLSDVINSNSPQWHPPTPQKPNFFFVNWYIDQDLTTLYTAEALRINTTLTLYAKYIEVDQEDYYLVSFVSMGGTFTPNQLIASGGLLIEPTIPQKEGYIFLYWQYVVSVSDKQGAVDFLEPITEHVVVEAVYSADTDAKRSFTLL